MPDATMKVARFAEYGPPEALQLVDIPRPLPGRREVLVKVHAAGVNPLDYKLRSGKMRLVMPLRLPFTPGFEVAGEVAAVGSAVKRWRVGDLVFGGTTRGGGWGEYMKIPERLLAAIPDQLSMTEAAAIPVGAATTLIALQEIVTLQEGARVLINGGSGGVGTFAVQLAAALGARITAVCGPDNVELVRELGAERVIDYSGEDFTTCGEKFDLVFDVVALSTFGKCSHLLKPQGVYVTTIPGPGVAMRGLLNLLMRPFGYRKRCRFVMLKSDGERLARIGMLARAGKFRSIIDSVHPLAEILLAQARVEGGHARGKVVVQVVDAAADGESEQ
jgi:NADPH:quinone reductase-like Zn-dependent oxidoreductase